MTNLRRSSSQRDSAARREAMQALGRKLIDERDRDAAIVLGDALIEDDLQRFSTGRVKPVRFRTRSFWQPPDQRIMTNEEGQYIRNIDNHSPTFDVPGFETLYNVDNFAKRPDEEHWQRIWAQWMTPWPETYAAMIEQGILPRTIADREIERRDVMTNDNELLAYRLHLVRPIGRRGRLVTPLFEVIRLESDNPATQTIHFDRAP